MNRDIQLHDSEISAVTKEGGSVSIFLSSAEIHESSGLPAHDTGMLWTQDVRIVIHGSEPPFPEVVLPIWAIDGTLRVGDTIYEGFIPAAGQFTEPTELTLVLSTEDGEEGGNLTVKGDGVTIELVGEPSESIVFDETPRRSVAEV